MKNQVIEVNATGVIKASSVGVSMSSGGISLGVIQISHDMVVLACIGLIVSILAFAYDFSHEETQHKNRLAFATALVQYMIFGSFALPAGFMITYSYFTQEVMACMLVGIFSSWVIVAVAKALKKRTVREVDERKIP